MTIPNPHSGLSQGTYLTNKYNCFKEIRDWVRGNNNSNVFAIRKTYGTFTRECDPTSPYSDLNQVTKHTNKQNHFKKIKGYVCGNLSRKRPCQLLYFARKKPY